MNPESLPREVVNPYIGGGDSVSRTPTAATRGDDVVLPAESDVVIVALYSHSVSVQPLISPSPQHSFSLRIVYSPD